MSVIKLEATEVEQTGLTKVNTFKTKRFNISTQTTAKNIRFTNSMQISIRLNSVEIENA